MLTKAATVRMKSDDFAVENDGLRSEREDDLCACRVERWAGAGIWSPKRD